MGPGDSIASLRFGAQKLTDFSRPWEGLIFKLCAYLVISTIYSVYFSLEILTLDTLSVSDNFLVAT